MKKAFIDQILLGFVLFSGIFIFIATINDDTKVRNKYNNLKDLTDNAALFAAKHYNINQDTINAESSAKDSISQTNLGLEVVNDINFTWDLVSEPKNVIAKIMDYNEDLFWYRLLSLDSFNLGVIESKAIILSITETSNFAPIAINQCNRDEFETDDRQEFEFRSYSEFEDDDLEGFYGITNECENPSGNSFFAHYKNIYNNPSFDEEGNFESEESVDIENDNICLPETDFENPNTVDPKQLYDKFKNFPIGSKMEIALIDCGSTSNDLKISSIIKVELESEPTCTQGTWIIHDDENDDERKWNEEDDDIHDREWSEEDSDCNGGNHDYKLLSLDLKIVEKNRIILEY